MWLCLRHCVFQTRVAEDLSLRIVVGSLTLWESLPKLLRAFRFPFFHSIYVQCWTLPSTTGGSDGASSLYWWGLETLRGFSKTPSPVHLKHHGLGMENGKTRAWLPALLPSHCDFYQVAEPPWASVPSLTGLWLLIPALLSLKAISGPHGFFDRCSCAMSLSLFILWVLATEHIWVFHSLFNSVGSRAEKPPLKRGLTSAAVGGAGFPLSWVHVYLCSWESHQLPWWTNGSADSGPAPHD